MREELRVIAAALAAYAVFLPVALWVGRNHVPVIRPAGKVVETLLRFDLDKPDRYFARSYTFSPQRYDASQLVVYEDAAPLPRENVWFTSDGSAYVVRIRPVDGSDPRTNGRHYWLVLPQ